MKKKSILTLILLILSGCCLLFSIMTMLGNDDPGSTEKIAERNIEPDPGDPTTVSTAKENTETTSERSKTSGTKDTEGTENTETTENTEKSSTVALRLPDDVPEYSGKPFYELNGNVPLFSENEKASTDSFENYSNPDILGRAGVAFANLSPELMPTEERGPIGQIRPSGWHTVKYNDLIDGNYLYNRCHLIAYSLAGENANEKNLITGTRYLNVEGMQPFEEEVLGYISRTKNHVLYRVTPIYSGHNPLASGVEMEAWSVEDQGKGVSFHVYCYNVQPGIIIDYTTGESKREDGKSADPEDSTEKNSESNNRSGETTEKDTESATTKKTENTTQSTEKPGGGLVPDSGGGKTIDPGEETTSSDSGDRSVKPEGQTYILNTNTKRIHRPTCSSVSEMKKKNRKEVTATIEELKEQGYVPCKRCLKGY